MTRRGKERKEMTHEGQASWFRHDGSLESTAPRKRFFGVCECYREADPLSSEDVVGGGFACTRVSPVALIEIVLACGHTP